MAKNYRVGDLVPCPECGIMLPLVQHPSKEVLIAYHNCSGKPRRAVFAAPIVKPLVPKVEKLPEEGADK